MESFINYLIVSYGLSEKYKKELLLSSSSLENILVTFILLTRRLNYIITFHELSQVVSFNLVEVVSMLSQSKYLEANYEEIINRFLFDFHLNYSHGCFIKQIYQEYQKHNHSLLPSILIPACFIVGLELIHGNQEQRRLSVFQTFSTVFPLSPQESMALVPKIKQMSIRGEIKTKNTYTRNMMRKHFSKSSQDQAP